MERPIYWFQFDDWFAASDGSGCIDWDADALALVLMPDGKISTRSHNSQHDRQKLHEEFPTAVFMGKIDRHRGLLECGADHYDKLRDRYPDIFRDLQKWTPFREPFRVT